MTGSGSIVKNGAGTLQINSVSATLATTPMTHNAGTISLDNVGATGATSVTTSTFTFNTDGAILQTRQSVAQDVRLVLPTLVRTAGATGYINNANAGTPSATNGVVVTGAAGVANQGIFLGTSSASAADFAYADGSGSFIRAANYGSDADTALINSAVADLSGNNEYHLAAGGSVTGATSQAVKTIKFTGGGNLTLGAGATLTLNTPGFLVAGGSSSTISGGTALTPASNREIVVRTDGATDTLAINTPITGSTGGLTKVGAGTLTLGAANTYTGNTVVNAGTLHLAAANAIQAGTLTLAGTGTLSQTVDNAIGGTTAVTINTPAGSHTLANANTYSGTTTLNSGILTISHNDALGSTAGVTRVNPNNSSNAATLQLTGNITVAETIRLPQAQGVGGLAPLVNLSGVNTLTGTLGMGVGGGSGNIQSLAGKLIIAGPIDNSGSGGGTPGLSFNGAGDYEISGSGTISSAISGGWSKTGNGTLTLFTDNAFGGGVSITGGTVNVRLPGALGTGGGTITANGGTLALQTTGTASFSNPLSLTGTGFGGNGALRNVAGTNTLTGTVNAGGSTVQSDSGLLILAGLVRNTNNQTATLGGGGDILVSGYMNQTIGGSGQPLGLTKFGPGTLTLTGANAMTNSTTLNGGTLAASAGPQTIDGTASTSGASTSMTVASTANLTLGQTVTGTNVAANTYIRAIVDSTHVTLSTASTGTVSGATFASWSSLGTGSLVLTNGTLALNGSNTGASASTTGSVTFNAGSSAITIDPNDGTSTTLTLGNGWGRNGGASLLIDYSSTEAGVRQVVTASATTSTTLTNGIYGWALVKDSAGLTGFATRDAGSNVAISRYDDTTGTTLAANSNASGTNFTTLHSIYTGGTLAWSSGITTRAVNSLTIDTTNSGGVLDLGASGNTLTLTSGAILFKGGNDATLTGGRVGAANSEVIIHQTGTATLTVNSPISSGTGRLTLDGTGLLVLGGANTYTNPTNVNGGTLRASDGTGLPTSSLLSLNNGVFETDANVLRTLGSAGGNVQLPAGASGFSAHGGPVTVALGGLATPTALTWGSASFNPASLTLNAATADNALTFANAIDLAGSPRTLNVHAETATMTGGITSSGIGGALTKGGLGTLVLGGTNTYAGPTAVAAGTLTVDGSLAGSAVNVASGASLGGIGTLAGAVTMADGTAITSANSLTLGGLTMADTRFDWELSGGATPLSSHLQINGNLTFNGTPSLRLFNLDNTSPTGTWVLMDYTGTLTGQPIWDIDYSATSTSTVSNWISPDPTGYWDTNTNWNAAGWANGTVVYDTDNQQVLLTGVTGGSALVPGSVTDVVIAPPNDVAVAGPSGPRTINSLVLGDSSAFDHSVTLQAGGPLSVNSSVTVNATGTLDASAAGLAASHLALNGTAEATLGAATVPTISVASGATLNLQGNLGTATTSLTSAGTTTFNPGAAGTIAALAATGGTTTVNAGATPTLTDVTLSGSANLTAAGGSIGALTLEAGYAGTVNVNAGTAMGGNVTVPSGAFNYNNGGTLGSLAVNGGSASLGGGSTATTATIATGAALALHDGTIGTIAASTGTIDTYAGATVGTATLTGGGTGAAVNTNGTYLTVTDTITIQPGTGDFTATYTGPAGGFGVQGGDLANGTSGILLNTAGGKVTLTQEIGSYVAGLLNGFVNGSTNATLYPTITVQELDLRRVQVTGNSAGAGYGWTDNQTIVYTGQMNFTNTQVNFIENFDDFALIRVKVDGTWQTLINNNVWNDVTTSNGHVISSYVASNGVLTLPATGWYEVEFRFGQGGGGIGANQIPWNSAPIMAFGYDSQGRATTTKGNYVAPADNGSMDLFRVGSVGNGPINQPTTTVTALATGELALPTGENHFGTLTLGGVGTSFTLSGATSVTFNGDVVGTGTTAVLLNGPVLKLAGDNIDATNPTDRLTLPAVEFSAPAVTVNASGSGTVIFSGATYFTAQGATLAVGGGLLQVDGSLDNVALTVMAGGRLGGNGTVGTIGGAGSVDPGDSPGLLTATQTDPSLGLDYNFEFTLANAVPNWAAVQNDVLHLTDPTTPFTSALDVDNVISLYLSNALYAGLVDGDSLYGGFYTDAGDHFLAISGAVLDVYYEDAGGTILYNGLTYSLLSDPLASFAIGTNAEVAPGGYLTQFNYSYAIIPEPASLALLAVGLVGLLRRRRP